MSQSHPKKPGWWMTMTTCAGDGAYRRRGIGVATLLAWILTLLAGCAGLSRRGPVAQDVIIARQLSQQGLNAMHHGSIREAEDRFHQAIARCPTNTTARYQLANCLWQRGARQEAIDQLQTALEMSGGDDVQMLIELGYMWANVGQLEEASQIAERAVRAAPRRADVWQLSGDVLKEQSRWSESLASYHRALTYDPDNANVQLTVAEIYLQLDRPTRLLATLHRLDSLIAKDRQPERMLVLKSMAYQQLERHQQAIDVLASAATTQRLSHAATLQLVSAQMAAGQYGEAQQTINRSLPLANDRQLAELRQKTADIAAQRFRDAGTVQR